MEKVIKVQYKIIVIDIVILLLLMLISLFAASKPMTWVLGYTFGGIMGILNFILLGRTLYKSSMMSPQKAQLYTSFNYTIRMIITAVVLIIGLKADYLNSISVIIGLLLIKQVIFFSQIKGNKKKYNDIINRKEDK